MKMHSRRFKDPLISQARPYTIIDPVIEESLRFAGVRPERELILERFMAGEPRIAVIHGSEDHPPSIGGRELARRVIQQIWSDGALPIGVSQAIPCEELSRGLQGDHYAFLGRNLCSSNIGALMEAHGYDAAFVLGACDKMLVGSLRALVEADLARQRRKARPVYASFIPVWVGPEVHVGERDRHLFEQIRHKLVDPESRELFALLELPMSPAVYENIKDCLDRAFHKRMILEAEKDALEGVAARRAASRTGCSSSEAAIVNRLIIAAFGLVPRNLDLSLHPPSEPDMARAVGRLIQGIHKRERRISVSQLVKTNLGNAVTVWNATGGYPSWQLHLQYLAEALGVRISPATLSRKMSKVPCLLGFDPGEGLSAPGVAAESDEGGNSGVDTLMRTLSEKRFIDDRVSTLDGSWMHRIADARSANGRFFYSTMTPTSRNSGLARLQGNLCDGALVRVGRMESQSRFDPRVYLVEFFLGREELWPALDGSRPPLDRLRKKVTAEDLRRLYTLNSGPGTQSNGSSSRDMARWDRNRMWDYLVEENLLRVMLLVAGEGPRASGMPEIGLREIGAELPDGCVLVTDGRIIFDDSAVSVAHITPEAIDGGPIASVRTGDWAYLNIKKGELHLVTAARNANGFRPIAATQLARRPESKKRILELRRRRNRFLPSLRIVLDGVSSAELGVSPLAP